MISLLAAHLTSAQLLLDSSRLEEAASHLQKAQAIYEGLGEDNPARKAYCTGLVGALQKLGHQERLGGRMDPALASYEKARSLAAEFVRRHPNQQYERQLLATLQRLIGQVHAKRGHWDQAADAFRQAIALRERLVQENAPYAHLRNSLVGVCEELGNVLARSERLEEALAAYNRATTHAQSAQDPGLDSTKQRDRLARIKASAERVRQRLRPVPEVGKPPPRN